MKKKKQNQITESCESNLVQKLSNFSTHFQRQALKKLNFTRKILNYIIKKKLSPRKRIAGFHKDKRQWLERRRVGEGKEKKKMRELRKGKKGKNVEGRRDASGCRHLNFSFSNVSKLQPSSL